MIITKEKALSKIDELISNTRTVYSQQGSIDSSELEKLSAGVLSIIRIIYGDKSLFAEEILNAKKRFLETSQHPRAAIPLLDLVKGILSSIHYEISNDLTGSIESQAQGEIFGDFISLAKQLLDEGYKESSAVLACGALEDSMKKTAAKHGLDTSDKDLTQVINSLKTIGVIKGTQSGLVQSYVKLRNYAFHAEFDKIQLAEIASLIAFIELFVLANFE